MTETLFLYEVSPHVSKDRSILRQNLDVLLEITQPERLFIADLEEANNVGATELGLRLVSSDAHGQYLSKIMAATNAERIIRIRMVDAPLNKHILTKIQRFSSKCTEKISFADFDDMGFFGSFIECLSRSVVENLPSDLDLGGLKGRFYYHPSVETSSYWFDFEDRRAYFEKELPDRYRIPGGINIEVASSCVLRCKTCWSHGSKHAWMRTEKRKPFMDLDLFERIIGQISEIRQDRPGIISPIYRGEPLLNRNLPMMIQKASRVNLNVLLVTNGMLLSKDLSKRLLDAGLWEIAFSVNSHREETYQKIHKRGNYTQVMKNIEDFLTLRAKAGRNDLRVCYRVVYQEDNATEMDDMIKAFFGPDIFNISFQYEILRPNGPAGGGRAWKKYVEIPGRVPCWNLWWNCTITTDGNVLPCVTCTNELAGEVMGNVTRDHLHDIWNDRLYSTYRRLHLAGQIDQVPFCNGCDQYQSSNWSNHPFVKDGVEYLTYPVVKVLRRVS